LANLRQYGILFNHKIINFCFEFYTVTFLALSSSHNYFLIQGENHEKNIHFFASANYLDFISGV